MTRTRSLVPDSRGRPGRATTESVALAFLGSASALALWCRGRTFAIRAIAILGALGLAVILPEPWESVMQAATLPGLLVLLLAEGVRTREDAWLHPAAAPRAPIPELPPADSRAWTAAAIAMAGCALPLLLGMAAGATWTLLLLYPAAVAAVALLTSVPLHGLKTGFPFSTPPTAQESAAIAFAGLITCAGTVLSGFLIWTRCLALLPAAITLHLTWTFVNRSAGVLSRGIHRRIEAEARGATPPTPR